MGLPQLEQRCLGGTEEPERRVPARAEPRRDVDERVAHPDQSGDERAGQIRVRDERPRDRESNLPAVRMTGNDEAVVAGDGLGRRVGRVHHGDAELLRRSARREAKIVAPDVCVVQTEELDAEAVQIHLVVDVRQVSPAVGFKT
jgi:hypothetical protein